MGTLSLSKKGAMYGLWAKMLDPVAGQEELDAHVLQCKNAGSSETHTLATSPLTIALAPPSRVPSIQKDIILTAITGLLKSKEKYKNVQVMSAALIASATSSKI